MQIDGEDYPGLYREISKSGASRYRILINHKKEVIQHYFYFGPRRTEEKALEMALKRWKRIRRRVPVLTRTGFMEVLRKPTASGVSGVTQIVAKARGYEYRVWKANWTQLDGSRKSKQFSILKYGTKEAKRLAIEARREALDEMKP